MAPVKKSIIFETIFIICHKVDAVIMQVIEIVSFTDRGALRRCDRLQFVFLCVEVKEFLRQE